MRGPSDLPKLGPQCVLPGEIVQRWAECGCGLTVAFTFHYDQRSEIKAEYERVFGAHVRAGHAPLYSDAWRAAL